MRLIQSKYFKSNRLIKGAQTSVGSFMGVRRRRLQPVLLAAALFAFLLTPPASAFSLLFSKAPQAKPSETGSENQVRQALEAAIKSLGGQKYLGIKTLIGRGLYSQFNDKGELQALLPFVDYIVYPDRERTEFGKGKQRFIQTNVGASGWIYDGEARNIRDQKEEEIANFQRGIRHNLDTILRERWRADGVKLRHLGEKELWFRQRGVGVEIAFPMDEDSREVVEIYFDPQTYRPVKLAYDNEEDRYYLYQDYSGVQVPLRVDHFRGDVQTARISYDSVELNATIDPKLFDKPPSPDKIK